MNERAFRPILGVFQALLLAAMLLQSAPSAADETEAKGAGPVRLRYAARESVARPPAPRPPRARALPDDLKVEAVARAAAPESTPAPLEAQGSAVGRRAPAAVPVATDLDRAAAGAALWTAEEKAGTGGREAYYRVGFLFGMQDALADEGLGAWDFRDGVSHGLRDPQAAVLGSEIAAAAAPSAVGPAAREQVEDQFRDLAREPIFRPRPEPPAFRPAPPPLAPPEIHEVFATLSPLSIAGTGPRFESAFRRFGLDPWRIHACGSHLDLYDGVWSDPRHAFDFWLEGPERSRLYRRLADAADRSRFRSVFEGEFVRALPRLFGEHLARGFGQGLEDGWGYGALVSYEWRFRLGYNEGFAEAVAAAAGAAFVPAYADAYAGAYEEAFDEWSSTPRPEIVSVGVVDGSGDGVFEPGEALLVEHRAANYGGAGGTFVLALEGAGLERSQETMVDLPARRAASAPAPLAASLRADLPPRRETEIVLRLAGSERVVPIRVSYPLAFRGPAVVTAHDSLAGRAVVEVTLANESRKPVAAAAVELSRVQGYDFREARDVGVVAAGATVSTVFELAGIRPLDLIGGDLVASFAVRRGDVVQDALELRLPDRASDLGDRDLLLFMVALARSEEVPRHDVRAARELMLRRLAADWTVAARGEGNAYKEDLEDRGARTALGDLVRTFERERRAMRSPEVFQGLGREIAALAEDLPGAHPFLRGSMKKLARALG